MSSRNSDLDQYLQYGLDFRSKSMDISGEISEDSTTQWLRSLRLLDRTRESETLTVYLNSTGGDVYQGLALYDTISSCASPVTIRVVGECMSMAVWVLQAADHREMTVNSRLMVHVGTTELPEAHAHTNVRWAKQWERDERILERILADRTGKSINSVRRWLSHDTIMEAETALENNLIDEVVR